MHKYVYIFVCIPIRISWSTDCLSPLYIHSNVVYFWPFTRLRRNCYGNKSLFSLHLKRHSVVWWTSVDWNTCSFPMQNLRYWRNIKWHAGMQACMCWCECYGPNVLYFLKFLKRNRTLPALVLDRLTVNHFYVDWVLLCLICFCLLSWNVCMFTFVLISISQCRMIWTQW